MWLQGLEFARRIRDEERGGNAHIHVVGKNIRWLYLAVFTQSFQENCELFSTVRSTNDAVQMMQYK